MTRCWRTPIGLGAVWVPFGAAEIQEAEVRGLIGDDVCIHAQRDLGVRMSELSRDPGDVRARSQREARERVSSIVETQRSHAVLLGTPSEARPGAAYVSLVECAAGLGAENKLRIAIRFS